MARLLPQVAALLVACCPPPGVRVTNPGEAPAGSAEIIAAAIQRYPDLRGEVTWVDGPMRSCGGRTYEKGAAGCTWLGGRCDTFHAYVVAIEPATASALLHELRHAAGDDAGLE